MLIPITPVLQEFLITKKHITKKDIASFLGDVMKPTPPEAVIKDLAVLAKPSLVYMLGQYWRVDVASDFQRKFKDKLEKHLFK